MRDDNLFLHKLYEVPAALPVVIAVEDCQACETDSCQHCLFNIYLFLVFISLYEGCLKPLKAYNKLFPVYVALY